MRLVHVTIVTLSLGVLLAACVRDEGPITPPTTPARELSGTAQGWDGGTATVQAVVTGEEGEMTGTLGASSPLGADGTFELTLPETPGGDVLTGSSPTDICEGEFDGTLTPEAWQEVFPEFVVQQNGETVGFLSLASSEATAGFEGGAEGDFVVQRLYVTEDVSVQGTCTGEGFTSDFDVEVEEGWNLIVITIAGFDDAGGFPNQVSFESVESVPTGAEWYFVENEPQAEPGTQSVVAEGLNTPLGVAVDAESNVYASDSGTGGDEVIATLPDPETGEEIPITLGDTARILKLSPEGEKTVVASLPSIGFGDMGASGVNQIAFVDGTLYAAVGEYDGSAEGGRPNGMAAVVRIEEDGTFTEVANTWDLERDSNPDNADVYTHPYDLVGGPDGTLYIADAGGNTLLQLDAATGEPSVFTAFDLLPIPNEQGNIGAEYVPTGVALGPDGNLYVSSFYLGVARVTLAGEVSPYATDVQLLTDLQLGPDGELYAVQLAEWGEEGPAENSGKIIRVKEGETSEVIVDGLAQPSAIAFNEQGDAFVTANIFGPPGVGQVVKIDALTQLEAVPDTEPTSTNASPFTVPSFKALFR